MIYNNYFPNQPRNLHVPYSERNLQRRKKLIKNRNKQNKTKQNKKTSIKQNKAIKAPYPIYFQRGTGGLRDLVVSRKIRLPR